LLLSAVALILSTPEAAANEYDHLAKVAEEQLADQERGAIGD